MKTQQGIVHIALPIILAILGVITFMTISQFVTFKDKLFSTLYPERVSYAEVNNISPTLNVVIYEPPTDQTGTLLSNQEVASKFSTIIYSRNQFKKYVPGYKTAGFNGKVLLYLTPLDQFNAPDSSFLSPTNTCNSTQKLYQSYSDNVDMDPGDFCEIQEAILTKTCLKEYTDICPTENWFLHNASNGQRIGKAADKGYDYKPNPGDINYRKYVAYRALREMIGGKEINADGITTADHPALGVTGIFLDNVELHWDKLLRANNGIAPREYSSDTSYTQTVLGLVEQVHSQLHNSSSGYNFPLWANLISSQDTGNEWDIYTSILEGGMMENFIIDWAKTPYPTSIQLNQISQAEKWISQGKYFVAATYGTTANFSSWGPYSHGIYLLITDGVSSTYRYDNSGSYAAFFENPNYYLGLGYPAGSKVKISDSPLIYRRDFHCGYVLVDMTNRTTSVTMLPVCNITSTPVPTTKPIATPTPTPTATPRPTNTPTPLPTSTPKPTSTPTPSPTAFPSPISTIVEAETMGLVPNSGAVAIYNDNLASGGRGLIFYENATSPGTVNLPAAVSTIQVTAKGDQCKGAPNLIFNIDGNQILSANIYATSWKSYATSYKLSPGIHNLSISFTNNYYRKNCDRNLKVDKITFQ